MTTPKKKGKSPSGKRGHISNPPKGVIPPQLLGKKHVYGAKRKELFGSPLTLQQMRFVEEFMKDGDGARAYMDAGYNTKSRNVAAINAYRLLTKPHVKDAIRAARAREVEMVQWSREKLEAMLRKNCMRAMQEVPVLDEEGNPTGEYKYEGAVANRSLELLAKMAGFIITKVDKKIEGMIEHDHTHTHNHTHVTLNLNELPTELLQGLLAHARTKQQALPVRPTPAQAEAFMSQPLPLGLKELPPAP